MSTHAVARLRGWVRAVAVVGSAALVATACVGTGASDVAAGVDLGSEVAVESSVPTVPQQSVDGLLYVAQARAASIVGSGAEASVTLSETEAEVLWFQDRPGRQAGEMRMSDFVDQWDELGFRSDPPNAVIRHDGDGLGSVVEMRDPVWDQPNGTLRFTAVPATGTSPLPVLMSDVSVFIDDGGSAYTKATVRVSNAEPGQRISVDIADDGASAPVWSTGEPHSGDGGLQLSTQSGSLPLTEFALTGSSIQMETNSSGGGSSLAFTLSLFLMFPDGTDHVQFRSESDPGVEVTIAIGDSVPQVVNQTDTEFALQP